MLVTIITNIIKDQDFCSHEKSGLIIFIGNNFFYNKLRRYFSSNIKRNRVIYNKQSDL